MEVPPRLVGLAAVEILLGAACLYPQLTAVKSYLLRSVLVPLAAAAIASGVGLLLQMRWAWVVANLVALVWVAIPILIGLVICFLPGPSFFTSLLGMARKEPLLFLGLFGLPASALWVLWSKPVYALFWQR